MKISGQANKRLCGLVSVDGLPLSPVMRLYAADVAGSADPGRKAKDVGLITSATRMESSGKEVALGFVKRGSNEIGTRLSAWKADDAAGAVEVEVAKLPFR